MTREAGSMNRGAETGHNQHHRRLSFTIWSETNRNERSTRLRRQLVVCGRTKFMTFDEPEENANASKKRVSKSCASFLSPLNMLQGQIDHLMS